MNTNTFPATEKQIAFAKALLEQRVVPQSLLAQAEEALLTKATASQFIGLLTELPRKVGSGRTATPNTVAPAPMRELPVGFYTVAEGTGHITFRISKPSWANGKTVIGVLNGSDNERCYKDFAFITERGFNVFRTQRDNHRAIAGAQFLLSGSVDEAREQFLNLAEANAMASNTCLCCLRTLTVPASVHRGLGPICAKKFGMA
jgi:hypothetical protein